MSDMFLVNACWILASKFLTSPLLLRLFYIFYSLFSPYYVLHYCYPPPNSSSILFIYLFAITFIHNSFTLSPIHFMFCHCIDNHPHKLLKSTQKKKKFKCYFRGFKWMFCHYFDHHPRKLLKFKKKKKSNVL